MASSEKVFIIELNEKADYQRILEGQPQTFGMRSGRVYIQPSQSFGRHSNAINSAIMAITTKRSTNVKPFRFS